MATSERTQSASSCLSFIRRTANNDQISEKKREIEKLTKEEKQITPVVNAPTFSERKTTRKSVFIGSNRVRV